MNRNQGRNQDFEDMEDDSTTGGFGNTSDSGKSRDIGGAGGRARHNQQDDASTEDTGSFGYDDDDDLGTI